MKQVFKPILAAVIATASVVSFNSYADDTMSTTDQMANPDQATMQNGQQGMQDQQAQGMQGQ